MYMAVSKNRGTPKSSILIGFSIINHPFWGIPIFGNIHINATNLKQAPQIIRVAKFKAIIAQKIHAMVRPANTVSQGHDPKWKNT